MNSPNFYQISFSQDFFHELALGMINKFPSINKNIIVLLPTKYACYSFFEKLKELKSPLPSIYAISELDQLVKITKSPLEKHGLINKICLMLLDMNLDNYDNLYAITELAEYFADLLYKIDLYQIDTNKLIQILDDNLSLHKQQISEIFKHFISKWTKNTHLTSAGYNNLLINEFSKNLKDKSLIIAGFNNDIPAIITLLESASKSPNASIIFYTDHFKEDQNISPSHPQYNLKSIAYKLNINSFKPWYNDSPSNEFISTSFASECSNWHNLKLNCDNIKFLSLSDQHQEAKAIIDLTEQNLDKEIMIITSDDDLMIKLMMHLKQKNIPANIVRDYPLNNCKTAIWLQLCAKFILDDYSLLSALALFKHPFSNIDPTDIELKLRDKNFFGKQIFDLDIEDLEKLRFPHKITSFKEHLNAHLQFAENIANQDIWQKELKDFLEKIKSQNEMEQKISFKEYSQLLNHFFKDAFYREELTKNNINLLKPIDARLHTADLVILAGLNEGIFPSKASIDPGFSNALLTKIGFPSHEIIISQEAHDFQSFANAKQVILTRAEKIDASVTTPSRWLLRMLTLSRNEIKENYALTKNQLILKKISTPITPPLEYRPNKFSATAIDKLIFNPYHIYVDLILKLKKLSPINKELSAADFGNFIHKAIEISSKINKPLIEAGKTALSMLGLNNPSIQTLWWPRFLRIASWFEINETKDAKVFLESYGSMEINNNIIVARADRIEEISSTLVNVIDYKTGKLPTKKSLSNGKSLQLLIEAIIAERGGFYWQNNKADIPIAALKIGSDFRPGQTLVYSKVCDEPTELEKQFFKSDRYKINSLKYILLSGGDPPAEILEIDLEDNNLLQTSEIYLENLLTQYQILSTPYHYSKKKVLGYCEYAHLSRNIG